MRAPGVIAASVNLATERATVTVDPLAAADIPSLEAAVAKAGYKGHPLALTSTAATEEPEATASDEDAAWWRQLRRRLAVLALGMVLTIPIVWIAMFNMNMLYRDYWLLALIAPVWLVVGWDFHRGALRAARHLIANMDTWVSAGATIAFVYSFVATFTEHDTFYDTTAVIVTFIYLGKVLEFIAKGARAALSAG